MLWCLLRPSFGCTHCGVLASCSVTPHWNLLGWGWWALCCKAMSVFASDFPWETCMELQNGAVFVTASARPRCTRDWPSGTAMPPSTSTKPWRQLRTSPTQSEIHPCQLAFCWGQSLKELPLVCESHEVSESPGRGEWCLLC